MNFRDLEVGRTYYRITFADRDGTMLGVEPLVYVGEGKLENGEHCLVFQDTVSYIRFGSRLAPGNYDQGDLLVHFVAPEEIGRDVLDLFGVAAQANEALARAQALGWPKLPVLTSGWTQAVT